MRLLVSGQIFEDRAEAGPPAAPGGGGGPVNTLAATHTGISTWVKIDTTNLWQAQGGNAPNGTLLTIDGAATDAAYTQPTAGSPIVTYLMKVGTHSFSLGGFYTATLDVYWRGWPWKAISHDPATDTINQQYFNGSWAVDAAVPASGNGWGDGAPYQSIGGLNNGYAMLPDAGPATSCGFIVAPGDQGNPTSDTRIEPNLTDNYALGAGAQTGSPAGGIDAFGNTDLGVRFYRFDYAFPTSLTAGVPVQNTSPPGPAFTVSTDGSATVTGSGFSSIMVGAYYTIAGVAYKVQAVASAVSLTMASTVPAAANVPMTPNFNALMANVHAAGPHKWPDGVTINPTTGDTSASATVTNTKAALQALSNLMENEGPAVFIWAGGTSGGANGAVQYRWQPTSLGVGLTQLTLDSLNVAWDTRYNTIVEYKPDLYASAAGVPWSVPAGTLIPGKASAWSAGSTVYPYGVPPFGTLSAPLNTGGPIVSLPITVPGGVSIPAGTALLLSTVGHQQTWSTTSPASPGDVTVAVQSQTPNFAYPSGAPVSGGVVGAVYGGGYVRAWRQVGGVFTCVSAGTTFAVPGTPTVVNGVIVGDPTTGADAGKIFGPTLKCQGANLLSGPDGGSVLLAGTAAPFDIVVNNVVSGTGFRPQGGTLLVGAERMTFSSYTSATKTLHVTARHLLGTAAVTHSAGEQVAGLIDVNVIDPGINQAASVPVPFCAREWPVRIGPTFASIGLTSDP